MGNKQSFYGKIKLLFLHRLFIDMAKIKEIDSICLNKSEKIMMSFEA